MELYDFDVEIGNLAGDAYPVVGRATNGQVGRAEMRFPFGTLALDNRLKDLQIALLRAGRTRRRMLSPEEAAVQDFGQALFDALFTGDVHRVFAESRSRARDAGAGLRIRLRCQSPELAGLPWEFLYDAARAEYLCLSTDTPLVRYVELPDATPPLRVSPPLRVLGMTANPRDLDALDMEGERQRIEDATAGLQRDGLLDVHWLNGHTWRDLHRALRPGRDQWHVFHFVGHGGFDEGTGEGLVALETDAGLTHRLSATDLGRLLGDHHSLRLVLLNSCEGGRADQLDVFSSTAATLVRRGAPAVVAMQYEITDDAAIEFSRSFYEAIVDGLPVDVALAESRKAVRISLPGSLEWGTPVLYTRATDGVLFTIDRSVERQEERREPPEPLGPSADDLVNQGLQYMEDGDLGAAERAFVSAMESDDVNAAAWAALNLGQLREDQGDPVGAREAWEHGLAGLASSDTSEAAGWLSLSLGDVCALAGETGRAEELLRRAVQSDDDVDLFTRAALSLGDLLVRTGETESARETYSRVAEMDHELAVDAKKAMAKLGRGRRTTTKVKAKAKAKAGSTAGSTASPSAPEREMIRIPAGRFSCGFPPGWWKGEDLGHQVPNDFREVDLDEFSIGRYPVTNAEFAEYVAATDTRPPKHWGGSAPPHQLRDHPVVWVTLGAARAYCSWLAAETGVAYRLPTSEEWEKAARGTDQRAYPWGNDWDRTRCHVGSKSTAPVTAHSPAGDSPYGVADMVGNAREFTGTAPMALWAPVVMVRGGGFNCFAPYEYYLSCMFEDEIRRDAKASIGFRLAESS